MMDNLGEETPEAEMTIISDTTEDINDTTLVPISNPVENNNINPSVIPIESIAPIVDYRRADLQQFIIKTECSDENEIKQLFHDMGLIKEKFRIILVRWELLNKTEKLLLEKMESLQKLENNIKLVIDEWDKIELKHSILNRRTHLKNQENKSQIKKARKTKQIFRKVESISEENDAKLVQIKNNLDSLENRIADCKTSENVNAFTKDQKTEIEEFFRKSPMAAEIESFLKAEDLNSYREHFKNYKQEWEKSFLIVKKNTGIAFYICLKNQPEGVDELLFEDFEVHPEFQEELISSDKILDESSKKAKEFWPERKLQLEKASENGEKNGGIMIIEEGSENKEDNDEKTETHHLEDTKDLPLVNNNLKAPQDLSQANEPHKPNQREEDMDDFFKLMENLKISD